MNFYRDGVVDSPGSHSILLFWVVSGAKSDQHGVIPGLERLLTRRTQFPDR
jgi:hypothetical protein